MGQSKANLRIGIDFDNTIIGYQQAFLAAANLHGLLPIGFGGNKQAVRDHVRALPDGERQWMRLQGFVYGKGIGDAILLDGVVSFLDRCRQADATVFIVSHKTEFGHFDTSRVNLRHAALAWMDQHGLFEYVGRDRVFFESRRTEKVDRIAALDCTHFIDDLEEVLGDPGFPSEVARILFTDGLPHPDPLPYPACADWRQISELIFDDRA